jgi:flagellar biosynthesis protein FliQ
MAVVAIVVGLFVAAVVVTGLLVSCLAACGSAEENDLVILRTIQFAACPPGYR